MHVPQPAQQRFVPRDERVLAVQMEERIDALAVLVVQRIGRDLHAR